MIGYQTKKGKFKAVYCHSDGYPSYTGKTLQAHYNSRAMAKALVKGGNFRFLENDIAKISRFADDTDAPQKFNSREEMHTQSFAYVWDDVMGWLCTDIDDEDKFKPLEEFMGV